MSLTINQISAVRTIQRVFRGSRTRAGLPRLRGIQVANLNAGCHLDVEGVNTKGFWSTNALWPEGRPMCLRHVLFSDNTIKRDISNVDVVGFTDYQERREKPLYKVIAMIESGIKGLMIYHHLMDVTVVDKAKIDSLFADITHSLKNGKSYHCNDSSSTRIDIHHLQSINITWLKYRYFAGLEPLTLVATCKPRLARQGPTTIAGGIQIDLPQPTDDLDLRFERLLNLQ
jgi:hypothetical protein